MSWSYSEIVQKANSIKKNVPKEYELGVNPKWAYYICKALLSPHKNINGLEFKEAPKPSGDNLSRQIMKDDYLDMASRLVKFTEKNKVLPNYIVCNGKKVKMEDYTYMFSRILVYYFNNQNTYPKYAEVNSKAFIKPTETVNEIYEYFIDVFGGFGNTIDGALSKIAGKGYGYYYDDRYSNRESIRRMKNGQGINCTDSTQVFYNIMLELIRKGKYKKVECLHVKCSGGDGHVRLRITLNDGSYIYRDPAAVLDSGIITKNWCINNYTLLAIDPGWWKSNLNR